MCCQLSYASYCPHPLTQLTILLQLPLSSCTAALVLFGWGEGYWLGRNSWGSDWPKGITPSNGGEAGIFKIKMGSNEVDIEAEVMFSLSGEKDVGNSPNCDYVKASGGTGGDGVACLKVVNTENSCTIKNECMEHVKMIDVAANNVASTPERCGTVIAMERHKKSTTLDPKEEREWKDMTDCCVNKAVKISADSLKTANEAWAAKHAKCPACFKQYMSGKDCMVQNQCTKVVKLYLPLPGSSSTLSTLFDDQSLYSQEPLFCYGRCPEEYIPPPACLVFVQTDKLCTITNKCDTQLDWVIETRVTMPDGSVTGSRTGDSVGAGETHRYDGSLRGHCAEVKVKNDLK